METIIVDGKHEAEGISVEIRARVQELRLKGIVPKLGIIIVGDDPASRLYIRRKKEFGERLGILVDVFQCSERMSTGDVCDEVRRIQSDPAIHGLIVQLPMPKHIDRQVVLDTLHPQKDIDVLTTSNQTQLSVSTSAMVPPTPAAMLHIAHRYAVDLHRARICIVGAGPLVGRPLAACFAAMSIHVDVVKKTTPHLVDTCSQADVLFVGTGSPYSIGAKHIKPGAIVIDAGTTFVNGKLLGDVDPEAALGRASVFTPTPGGVGPLTVAMLFRNLVTACEK